MCIRDSPKHLRGQPAKRARQHVRVPRPALVAIEALASPPCPCAPRRLRRLSDEIDSRVEKGSHILIAIDDDADGAPPPEAEAPPPPPPPEAAAEADPSGATIDGGTYLEPGLPLLGTVDSSVGAAVEASVGAGLHGQDPRGRIGVSVWG